MNDGAGPYDISPLFASTKGTTERPPLLLLSGTAGGTVQRTSMRSTYSACSVFVRCKEKYLYKKEKRRRRKKQQKTKTKNSSRSVRNLTGVCTVPKLQVTLSPEGKLSAEENKREKNENVRDAMKE